MTNEKAVLGGWVADTKNVPDGAYLVSIPMATRFGTSESGLEIKEGDTVPHGAGDKVHIAVEFDVMLEHGIAGLVNGLIQAAMDGVAAGAFEITGESLIRLDHPANP